MGRPRWHRTVLWAAGFSAITTAALGVLTWALAMMHALTYGSVALVAPDIITAPEPDRYRLAVMVGAVANVLGAVLLARLAPRTPARAWSAVAQGLAAALLAAVVAVCALLLTLGISPVDFVAALVG